MGITGKAFQMGGIVFLALIPPYVGIVITHHFVVATLDTIEYIRTGY